MTDTGTWWLCCAPYSWTDRILDDGSGPTFEENHVLYVYARTSRRAQWLAVRAWRRAWHAGRIRHSEEPYFLQDPDVHPFSQTTIDPVIPDDH